jgi:hypothetical protein
MKAKRVAIATLFGLAFIAGLSGQGGHSSAVSLSATQHDTDRHVQTSRGALWSRQDSWLLMLSRCIRDHESINAGHYKAQDPRSSASGAYSMIDSLWRGASKWTPNVGVYAHAYQASPVEQDRVFLHIVSRGGLHHWNGTGCPGTTR